MYYAFNYQMFD